MSSPGVGGGDCSTATGAAVVVVDDADTLDGEIVVTLGGDYWYRLEFLSLTDATKRFPFPRKCLVLLGSRPSGESTQVELRLRLIPRDGRRAFESKRSVAVLPVLGCNVCRNNTLACIADYAVEGRVVRVVVRRELGQMLQSLRFTRLLDVRSQILRDRDCKVSFELDEDGVGGLWGSGGWRWRETTQRRRCSMTTLSVSGE